MENILLPSKMTFAQGSQENESILTIEPLHHGYGTTVGNALRRVLLSSLEGAAVTSMKIKGVQHEFSSVDGVKEDGLEIVLNLKKLRMTVHTDQPVTLTLEATGEGEIKAKDISANADVEIANPDLTIATLTSKESKLNMEITVQRGRGFWPTEERDNSALDIGTIAIDSVFSPVLSVGIRIENTRVGEITNYDKLIMSILTDGTVTAQNAVKEATKVIQNHFNWIENQFAHSTLSEMPAVEAEETETVEEVNEAQEEIEESDE